MKDFDKYLKRSNAIIEKSRNSGDGLGHTISWLMILVGVVVTGVQTHSLALNGMKGSNLYRAWLDIASWLPVILLEGTAIGLTLGRLYFFKSTSQRSLGHIASFAVWLVLAFNTVAAFSISYVGQMSEPLVFYARYVLPFALVGVPYLWKALIDRHPDSLERIFALEVEAESNAQWRAVQREQNETLVGAYRAAGEKPEVKQAIEALVEKAAITRAAQIIGMVDMHDTQQAARQLEEEKAQLNPAPAPRHRQVWRGGQMINGQDQEDTRSH
jgi:hypothetical protein